MEGLVIQTKLVNEVVIAYREWYKPEVGCVCNNDPDYTINVDGVPLPGVCSFHEWQHKRQQLQQEIIKAGLSYPIPKMLETVALPHGYNDTNPVHRSPDIPLKRSGGATYASKIVARLAQTHIVVYLNRTKFIDLSYNQRGQEVEDIVVWSPVLVYHRNSDARKNGHDEALMLMRQFGWCYVVQ